MEQTIEAWEGEGGAATKMSGCEPGGPVAIEKMMGTANQLDWAEQIKVRVSAEFDRVARALASAASKQTEADRMNTLAVIAILEDKRAEVMRNAQAGYFIHDWQELRDQVRRMIVQDSRYKTIKANQELADKSHKSTLTGG